MVLSDNKAIHKTRGVHLLSLVSLWSISPPAIRFSHDDDENRRLVYRRKTQSRNTQFHCRIIILSGL